MMQWPGTVSLCVSPDDPFNLEHTYIYCHRTSVVSGGGLYLEDRDHGIVKGWGCPRVY